MGDHLQGDYLAEALRLVPTDFETDDLDLVRSYGFLALLGMQTGANAMLHKYLGLYHGLCAQLDFHDEARWPADISECERESRRRVWWAMYRLEVHTSCVLGNPVRVSEVQCYVRYPCGTHHPNFIPGRNGEFEDWFTGWNTTTDLYRVLEHAISDLRVKRRPANSILGVSAPDKFELIMQRLSKIQEDLLPQFGTISFRSDDSGKNRCGFQASHILCTVHLARLMSCISGRDNITLACYTAREMITSIENIPQEYFRAIGSPLIQQLVGVGHILISVADARDLSEDDSSDIREIVQSLVTLLRQWYPQNTEGAANLERLTTRLTQTDILQQTREFVVRERGFSELEGRNTHCDLDDFTSQLLMNFDWPYLEL